MAVCQCLEGFNGQYCQFLQTTTTPCTTTTTKEKILTKENNSNKKMSMFSDIKEVLKAVEYSKTKIDANLAELARERDNKMFYLLNSHLDEELFIFVLYC